MYLSASGVRFSLAIVLGFAWTAGCSAVGNGVPFGEGGSADTGGGSTVTTGSGGSAATTGSGGLGFGGFPGSGGTGTGGSACLDVPPTPAGPEAVIAPEYANLYKVYDLGTVPGAPPGYLGGCVIRYDDPNTLLFGSDSELPAGAIYAIKLKRGPCGHIVGFDGTAVKVADTPYVDANLVYGPSNVLFYTQWPTNQICQLLPGQTQPASTTDGLSIGVNTGDSVSGFGFVPPWLTAAGQPRTVTWSGGHWYHLTMTNAGQVFGLSNVQQTVTLQGGPGGFAYIPQGSSGFPKPAMILSEWSINKVATYEVDPLGDPMVATRKDFFSSFPRPWGAYFESQTGDFLFLTWGSLPDRVYVVQGFALPPPPPPPPQ